MRFSREFQLVAACCRWPRSPAGDAAVRHAAHGAIDWPLVGRIVARHRVAPLVHDALRRAAVPVPPALAARLARRTARTARLGLAMAQETADLHAAFRAAGIDLLFLKGTTVAALAYGNIAIKQSLDIDLLVAPADALAARHLLEARGYRLMSPAGFGDDAFARYVRHAKETNFRHPDSGMLIDLHCRLSDNRLLLPAITVGGPAQPVALGGGVVGTLADAELVAYLCAHGTRHCWARLKWLADAAALVAGRSDAALAALAAAAHRAGGGRSAAVMLLLSHETLGLPLSPGLRATLAADRVTRWLVRCSRHCLMHGGAATEIGYFSRARFLVFATRFFIAPGWRFFVEEARVRLTSPHDRATIVLPRRLHFLYHVIRLPRALARQRHR